MDESAKGAGAFGQLVASRTFKKPGAAAPPSLDDIFTGGAAQHAQSAPHTEGVQQHLEVVKRDSAASSAAFGEPASEEEARSQLLGGRRDSPGAAARSYAAQSGMHLPDSNLYARHRWSL